MASKENTDPNENGKMYICQRKDCGRRFKTQSGRSKHHKTCEKETVVKEKAYAEEDGKAKCKQCNKTFGDVRNFYKHNRKFHKGENQMRKQKKVHLCIVCSKVFAKESKLRRHEAAHTRPGYSCETCGRSYLRIDHFNSHADKCKDKAEEEADNEDDDFIDFFLQRDTCSYEATIDEAINVSQMVTDKADDDSELDVSQPICNTTIDENLSQTVYNEATDTDPELDASRQLPKSTRTRKVANLSNVLQKIVETNLNPVDQAKILRGSLEQSVNRTVLDSLMVPVESESVYEARLVSSVLDYLKGLNLKIASDKKHFHDLLHYCCNEETVENEDFLRWLAKRLDKRPHRILRTMNSVAEDETRGRKGQSLETRQAVFDAWHDNSIVTVDRRDGRDQVTMKEMEYAARFSELKIPDDVEVEYFRSKRNQRKVRSTRRIATKALREIKKKLAEENHNVSVGFIIALKPFYVQNPTEREKESCLCKFCLNLRLRFVELNKHLKDKERIVHSMSQYYANGSCDVGCNGFQKLQCITMACEKCHLKPMLDISDFNIPMNDVKFHQFTVQTYSYLSKSGQQKEGKRTIRTEFSEPFVEFKEFFDRKAQPYLLHRYEIKNDLYHWAQILDAKCLGYIFHQDYSENISCSPKFEPQDAHFSSKQTSLHCTVVHSNEEKTSYAYHISDNKGHDSVFTSLVTRDLLEHYGGSSGYPLVRIKSDNCTTQYCCLYVFAAYRELSKEIGKPIILYYGVNGHGRGLVDAMSGFGVKSPLRRAIITDNFFFHSDEELVTFLKRTFEDDSKKYYTVIPSEVIDQKRQNRGEGFPIAGCQKSRMMAFFPDGTWQKKRHMCSCRHCKLGEFDKCVNPCDSINDVIDDELDLLDETEGIDPEMYTFIEENTYIALYSSSKSFELFYLLKVIEKSVATEDMIDIYGHSIQKGAEYICGHYLEKINEKNGKVFYKALQKRVYVYPAEVFCPAVQVDQTGLFLTAQEYQFLADSI